MDQNLILKLEEDIKRQKEHLEWISQIKDEHSTNVFMEWLTGVVAPFTKAGTDIGLEVLEKRVPGVGNLVKESYDLTGKLIDIKYSNGNERSLNLLELFTVVEETKGGRGSINFIQSFEKFKSGDIKGSIVDFTKGAENILDDSFKGLGTVADASKSISDGLQNIKTINEDSERMTKLFDAQIQKTQDQINENEGLLYKYSGGKKGDINGLLNSKNNFRRLDGFLIKIETSIQQVQKNLH